VRLAVAAALLAVAAPALGQEVKVNESGRWGSFTLEGATFTPDIDTDFAPPGPYETVFGESSLWSPWMFRGDFNKTLWDAGYGAVEVGLGLGYFARTGNAIDEGTGQPTGEETKLKILPLTASIGYRFDMPSRRWDIPLMAFVKGNVQWDYWWVTGLDGNTVESGGTWGYGATGGVGFLLDFIDRAMAREADRDTGVNDTWLVFDVTKSWVDDFGSSSSWKLGTKGVSLGVGLVIVF
jgi:hypothetical protein